MFGGEVRDSSLQTVGQPTEQAGPLPLQKPFVDPKVGRNDGFPYGRKRKNETLRPPTC